MVDELERRVVSPQDAYAIATDTVRRFSNSMRHYGNSIISGVGGFAFLAKETDDYFPLEDFQGLVNKFVRTRNRLQFMHDLLQANIEQPTDMKIEYTPDSAFKLLMNAELTRDRYAEFDIPKVRMMTTFVDEMFGRRESIEFNMPFLYQLKDRSLGVEPLVEKALRDSVMRQSSMLGESLHVAAMACLGIAGIYQSTEPDVYHQAKIIALWTRDMGNLRYQGAHDPAGERKGLVCLTNHPHPEMLESWFKTQEQIDQS